MKKDLEKKYILGLQYFAEPPAPADPPIVEDPNPETPPREKPYRTFATKDEFTEYIKKAIKNKEEEANKASSEMERMKQEIFLIQNKELLKDFQKDTREFLLAKIDKEKDLKEQVEELKKQFPSMLKVSKNAVDKVKPTKEDKEKIEEGVVVYEGLKVHL